MALMSIDGLITGLNTSELISQLLTIEAAPQTALKNKVAEHNKAISAYQAVNTKMAALLNAAKAVNDPKTWTAMKATASSNVVAVTAAPGADVGELTFKVDRLATSHTVIFSGRVSSLTDPVTDPVISGSTIEVLLTDGTTTTVTPADASLYSIVKAINETENAAYRAAAIQVAPGEYTLQLTAVASGSNSAFAQAAVGTYTLTGLDGLGTGTVITEGNDAQITVGSTVTFTVTSHSNTFVDVLPGVTITVLKAQSPTDDPVTVSVAPDHEAIAAKVQALYEAVNVVLGEMKTQTAAQNGSISAGTLVGDAAVRQLIQDILSAVSGGAGEYGSYSTVGIELDRFGNLTFNKEKFLEALKADPERTRKLIEGYDNVPGGRATELFEPGHDIAYGLARKLETIARRATEGIALPTDPVNTPKEGLIAGLIKRRNELIASLNEQIDNWDLRLAAREAALKRQFSMLEVSLSRLQQQSMWLAGQIASLA
ncbi:MAG TPA: flagellar filament capping protein FliD [Micromonospora sp.]